MPSHEVPRPDWIRSVTETSRGVSPPSVSRPGVARPSAPTTLRASEARALRAFNNRRIQTFARECEVTLTVEGGYKRGPSYQTVLDEYLPEMGKNFTAPSRTMREDLRHAIEDENAGRIAREQISFASMERSPAAQDAVRDRVVARFENRSRDVRVRANKPSYTLWKSKHGFNTRVGIRTGDLLAAVKQGRVRLRYRAA
jgi:hypothetical protein